MLAPAGAPSGSRARRPSTDGIRLADLIGNQSNSPQRRTRTRGSKKHTGMGTMHWQHAHREVMTKVGPKNIGGIIRELESQGLVQRHQYKKRNWWVIDPRSSRAASSSDIVVAVALIFTILVTPWEVSFLAPAQEVDLLFVFNRIMDTIFFVDMCFQFVLMYPTSSSANDGARWEDDPGQIVRHYLCTWFTIDIVSIGVSGLDCARAAPARLSLP